MFDASEVSGGHRWPLVRISSGGETKVVLLACEFLPLSVHWIGRSVVCAREACDLCELLPIRALFYLPVMCMGRTSILELASQSSSHFEQHCKLLHGGIMPGLQVRLSRRSAKSPVYSEVIDKLPGVRAVSREQFASRVAALYHLPGSNPGEDFFAYQERLLSMVRARASNEALKLRDSSRRV